MSNHYKPLQELEKLSHFLQGAHSVCDHEKSHLSFHQAKHHLDEIINHIKINSKPYVIDMTGIKSGSTICPKCKLKRFADGICWNMECHGVEDNE